ncbi:MAG: glucose-1-phosphate adenylyltransferase [Vicinamibacteria bacterium]|nr:glucose-1-phosphate adenylyltransferase [Vicinamibacteria bacterium]
MEDTLVIVLAGGVGERLYPLTKDRAKPAVYFGGPYRIIDFPLSNCINSGLRRIFIATQYKSLSLNRHIRQGWGVVSEELGEFIEILPPQKRVSDNWYLGTADAVYQNLYSLQREAPRHVIVLSGDHVYKMDYAKMLQSHIERGAKATLATLEVSLEEAHRFGIVTVDEAERVVAFHEKPSQPTPMPGSSDMALASMGVYIFEAEALVEALEDDARQDTQHDFGKNIIPTMFPRAPVCSYRFSDENQKAAKYWRDIGTLDAYYEANMDLCHVNPEFNLYDPAWPLRTYMPQAPPAKFVFNDDDRRGMALDSIISTGCIVSGSKVVGSVLCPNVRVHSYCSIEHSILMPGVRVGRHSRIRNAIIDRDVLIPRGAVIGYHAEEDRRRHTVSEGGVVVVTVDEEPFIGPVETPALRLEADADGKGLAV